MPVRNTPKGKVPLLPPQPLPKTLKAAVEQINSEEPDALLTAGSPFEGSAVTVMQGKKTYLVALVLLVVVVVEQGLGFDVPGVSLGEDWLVVVMSALGLGSLRSAINSRPT